MEEPRKYCKWVSKKLEKGPIFIFSDKNYCNFRNAPYKKQCITQIKGETTKLYMESQKTKQFSFMYKKTIYINTKIKTFIIIFEVETVYEKKTSKKSLEA